MRLQQFADIFGRTALALLAASSVYMAPAFAFDAGTAKVALSDGVWPTGGYAGPNGDDDSHSQEPSADEERTALPEAQKPQPPPPPPPPYDPGD